MSAPSCFLALSALCVYVLAMFEGLQGALEKTLSRLKGTAKIREADVEEALVSLKTSLLEADVSYSVVTQFIENVRRKALGAAITSGLNAYQQFLKIVYEEMLGIFGPTAEFALSFKPPVIVFMVGLQGAGKTTSCGKLANFAKKKLKRKPLLVSVDVTRPAAIEQLERLSKDAKIDYFKTESMKPLERAQQAIKYAQTYGLDLVIVDTAGRLSIDEALMTELAELKAMIQPHHVLYVADSMSGQQGLQVATGFSQRVGLTGCVLSKSDADTRGGVAFSIREALKVPLQFVGAGEKLEQWDVFHPDRWIGRILGQGDVASLLEKAKEVVDAEGIDEKAQARKMAKGELSLLDFQQQMKMIKKMGSMGSIMGMIPGMSQFAGRVDQAQVEKKLKVVDAMINSMTPHERAKPDVINGDRKRRIAKGSGTQVEEINQFLNEFRQMQQMMKKMGNMKGLLRGAMPGFGR